MRHVNRQPLTELDAGVLLADLVALLVREEHVSRETALGGVGICLLSVTRQICRST